MIRPRCSVVIPSYNRCASLERVLEALAGQTLPSEQFEVVVVLDGSSDGSEAMLERRRADGRLSALRWLRQPNGGQAAARSAGTREARADVVVFLDDDVVPEPDLLETHLRWHERGARLAVMGSAHIARGARPSFYQLLTWGWWEDFYHERAQAGRLPGYRDFCAGNVSLRRDDFQRVGGFDPAFRGYGGEDFDLGYRLQRSGVRLISDPAARATHHHTTTPLGLLRNVRDEGRQDILLGRKHPALRRGLRIMQRPQSAPQYFANFRLYDAAAVALAWTLPLWEWLGLHRIWRELFGRLRHHAYWRGVRETLGRWDAVEAFWAEAPPMPEVTLDVTNGIPERLPPMPVDGPLRVHVEARGQRLGTVRVRDAITGPVREALAEAMIAQLMPALLVMLPRRGPKPDAPRMADFGSVRDRRSMTGSPAATAR